MEYLQHPLERTPPFPNISPNDLPCNVGLNSSNRQLDVTADLFPLPQDIIDAARHLDDLSLGEDNVDCHVDKVGNSLSVNLSQRCPDLCQPTTPNDLDILPMSSDATYHKLGKTFSIQPHEVFDMVTAFPNSLISMTHILQCFRQAGAPLYLVDLVMKVISDEVSAHRLNFQCYPSYDSTMLRLSNLFHVPKLTMLSIPLEHTLREQQNHIYHQTPVFPAFSFVEQLQDLLSLSDVFQDLDNLVVNPVNRWHPYQRTDDTYEEI